MFSSPKQMEMSGRCSLLVRLQGRAGQRIGILEHISHSMAADCLVKVIRRNRYDREDETQEEHPSVDFTSSGVALFSPLLSLPSPIPPLPPLLHPPPGVLHAELSVFLSTCPWPFWLKLWAIALSFHPFKVRCTMATAHVALSVYSTENASEKSTSRVHNGASV